jgi:hypothetical protein
MTEHLRKTDDGDSPDKPIVFARYDSRKGYEAICFIFRPDRASLHDETQITIPVVDLGSSEDLAHLQRFIAKAETTIQERERADEPIGTIKDEPETENSDVGERLKRWSGEGPGFWAHDVT